MFVDMFIIVCYRIIGAPTKLVKLCHNDDDDGDDSCIVSKVNLSNMHVA